jgi:hypothetical protein
MKTLYLGPKVNLSLPFVLSKASRLVISVIALLFSLASFSQELVFWNPQLVAGIERADGAVYRSSNGFNAVVQNKQVMLNWATIQEKNVSHFVIEKSSNGADYSEAALIFTDGNSKIVKSYTHKDPLTGNNPFLYYRLRIVDLAGTESYSQVRMIRTSTGVKGQLELMAYPNPVASELRITIPESWQNKQVTYELYDGMGRLLKRVSNKNASQTEVFNMNTATNGTYLIKAYTTGEALIQRVVKS